MKTAAFLLLLLGVACAPFPGRAADVFPADKVPPAPTAYCNDYAGLLTPNARERIDARLRSFEQQTSTQILVVLFPQLDGGGAVEDATVRMAEAWGVGRKGKDNGVILFLFAREHRLRIEVGYGLEGAIPDITAKRIIAERITPRLRAGDYDGGIEAGVNALISAAKGEPFVGNGRTVHQEKEAGTNKKLGGLFLLLVFGGLWLLGRTRVGGGRHVGQHYTSTGSAPFGGFGGWGGGGGGWGGGGGGGDGGGFSGGGGGFGGGGSGGSW